MAADPGTDQHAAPIQICGVEPIGDAHQPAAGVDDRLDEAEHGVLVPAEAAQVFDKNNVALPDASAIPKDGEQTVHAVLTTAVRQAPHNQRLL
ncbi:MAG: hypothetical protein WD738_12395 [Pirellulales bacterium]